MKTASLGKDAKGITGLLWACDSFRSIRGWEVGFASKFKRRKLARIVLVGRCKNCPGWKINKKS